MTLVLLDTNAYLRLAKRVRPMLGKKFGQIRAAIVVTDDLGMHELANMVGIDAIWHGHELLKKMLSAKLIENELVREIYAALEANGDLPATWVEVKHSVFAKVFGKNSA